MFDNDAKIVLSLIKCIKISRYKEEDNSSAICLAFSCTNIILANLFSGFWETKNKFKKKLLGNLNSWFGFKGYNIFYVSEGI